MKNKTTRFLIVSLVCAVLLCVCVFSVLLVAMDHRSKDTINDVGTLYMSGMSEEIAMHFSTTMELRLSQLDAIVDTLPPESADHSTLSASLAYSAQVRGFEALSLLSDDGSFEPLFGEQAELEDPDSFLMSLRSGEKKIAVATDEDGDKVILMGIPVAYCLESGGESLALVASLPAEYVSDTLSLDEDDSMIYSHIIRKDGTFVIRSGGAYRQNYFERIRGLFEEMHADGAEAYVEQIRNAMDTGESYSTVMKIGSDWRHLNCTKLDYSEWFLISVMPYGELNAKVSKLSTQWAVMALSGCAVILIVLLLIFSRYFSLTRQQIRELEEARQAAERANKAKGEFLSNMSHDIRTPMNAIVGMTAIATANIGDQYQVQNCLKKIALSSKHLLGLINDVLDMSKIESGKMTLNISRVSLPEVMESIVSIVQPQVKAKNQQFDVSIHDIAQENVCCDSVRLNQVILNLLSNAIKFTPEGGNIHVALYEETSPRGADYVRIHLQVKDSGIGMTKEFQEKIFDSFTREDNTRVNRTEGTGLGMAITKYIVDAMEGTIELDSTPGEGTEFRITLDMEKAVDKEVDMILPAWKMLVVDDDQLLCESAARALKDIGVQAEWTLDGETALEMVAKRHAVGDDYQIILLDWKLPGINGIETARRIRKELSNDVSILLISAYDWSEIEDDARSAGVNGFISKPLFKSTLFYGLRPFMEGAVQPEAVVEEKITFEGRHILLAEDNELNWEIASELLSELGLELDWAENGKICLEKFQSQPEGYYDAILMDIRMPVMTGYEATEAIRGLSRPDAKDIPIIAMTADAFSEDIKRCLEHGMNAHVAKPIDVQEVARLLRKYIK